jgi:hypothetical protein
MNGVAHCGPAVGEEVVEIEYHGRNLARAFR